MKTVSNRAAGRSLGPLHTWEEGPDGEVIPGPQPLDRSRSGSPFSQPPSTVAPAAAMGLGVIIIGGIIILLSPVGL